MIIKTKEDWWELAIETLPKVKDYVLTFIGDVQNKIDEKIEEAEQFIKDKDHAKLYLWYETLWEALPDRQIIRFGPFFDICDICSEYAVFYEENIDEQED